MGIRFRRVRPGLAAVYALVLLVTISCTAGPVPDTAVPGAPAEEIAAVCGNTVPGPAEAPRHAVRVDPAIPSDLLRKTDNHPPGTTFWLAPGRHRLGNDEYDQVAPKNGNSYLGAPGAVLDGRGVNRYAFAGKAAQVSIKHLKVTGFVAPVNEGVVNHDSGAGWVISHNTLAGNDGGAMMAGRSQVMRGNCLKDNGQYGLNACCGSVTDLVLEGNEFVGNNADDLENKIPGGCGCTGAMKFWEVDGADIRGNWIHHNRGTGIWADTNNNDFLIENNLIENNDGSAIFYETSYNAVIRDNTIRRNNIVGGKGFVARGDSFPAATIYVSEAGGEPRVPARTDKIEIYRNFLEDNWGGITLWENADRFCNSPANSSTGSCTLLVKEPAACTQPAIATAPLVDDCRWKTQRVEIHDNRFDVNPAAIGCSSMCARMALLSNYGTVPRWSPYKARVVQEDITFAQQNRWYDNTYLGPWSFLPYEPSRLVGFIEWQRAPYLQDKGSNLVGGAGN